MIKLKSIVCKILNSNTPAFACGVYEEKSFKSKPNLNGITIIKKHTEKHPEASGAEDDSKTWTVVWFSFPQILMTKIQKELKLHLWTGWDSMLWNKDNIHVVFHNGISKFPNDGYINSPKVRNWSGLERLAKSNNINLSNLQKVLPSYFKPKN